MPRTTHHRHRDQHFHCRNNYKRSTHSRGPAFACAQCHRRPTTHGVKQKVQLQVCSGCLQALYCSRKCQRQHWEAGHNRTCTTHGWIQMMSALDENHAHTVTRLSKLDSIVNAQKDVLIENCGLCIQLEKWAPLHGCAQNGTLEMLRLILEGGVANVHQVNGNGETPLSLAVQARHDTLERVQMLLHAGAKPDQRSLAMALERGDCEVAEALMEAADHPIGHGLEVPGNLMDHQRPGESMSDVIARFQKLHQLLQRANEGQTTTIRQERSKATESCLAIAS